ncbi:hypothetical protein [Vibrio paucivorans]|uniref:Uncharacterized protein n=1 Tax=Vibrio paucivorans TaxID=2829489 RepID=A0A9X3CEX4_9VIBR|nr:hypothetical protein [Vibrio paucivorans]MCW8334577.1 hypothetical protein [Vibrio paucivorans]
MRKLQIDTYSLNRQPIKDSTTLPLFMAKAMAKRIPKALASKFDENGEQLEQLVQAVVDAKETGVIYEVVAEDENERIVFSIF